MVRPKWFSFSLLTALLFTLVSRANEPSCSEHLLAQTSLSPEQAQAFLRAASEASDDIEFKVLTKSIDGRLKTLIILGESHAGKPDDLRATKPLIDQFQFIGTEDGPATHDPNDVSFGENAVITIGGLLALPEILVRNVTKGAGSEPISPMTLAKRGKKVRYVFNLEKGHSWSWREMLSVIKLGAESGFRSFCVGACAVQGFELLTHGLQDPSDLIWIAGATSYLLFLKKYVQRWTDPDDQPLELERDPHLARNVDWLFEKYFDNDTYLAIVGRRHVDGMVSLLEKSGYMLLDTEP